MGGVKGRAQALLDTWHALLLSNTHVIILCTVHMETPNLRKIKPLAYIFMPSDTIGLSCRFKRIGILVTFDVQAWDYADPSIAVFLPFPPSIYGNTMQFQQEGNYFSLWGVDIEANHTNEFKGQTGT